MKIAFWIICIYLVVTLLLFLAFGVFNGSFDQSKEPVVTLIKRAFKWPLRLLQGLAGLIS